MPINEPKPLKVLMLNYEFPPLGGGAGNANYYLLKELARYPGLKIDLVTSSASSSKEEIFAANIRIHYLNINKKGRQLQYQTNLNILIYTFKAFLFARKLAKNNHYNICHAFFGIPCGFIALFLKLPYVVSLRGSDVPFYNKRFYWLDKIILKYLSHIVWKNASAVTALSKNLVNLARKTSNQKIEIIYNGVDTEKFKPDKLILKKEKTFNLVFAGRLIERKGLTYLIKAFLNLEKKYPELRLQIAGDGPLFKQYLKMINDNQVGNKVILHGFLESENLALLYRKSHLFVLPSLNEALGNATLEALSSGLPIITTDTGAAELINGNGIVVKKKNAKDIEKAIIYYLDKRELLDAQSVISRNIAVKMSWKGAADAYFTIYNKLAQTANL
jgi:L-malate glycosyltransferase